MMKGAVKGQWAGGKGKGKLQPGPAQQQNKVEPPASVEPFRSRLKRAMQQKYKTEVEKDWILYLTEKDEDGWNSIVQCDKFNLPYASEGPALNSKQAEENAAAVAMKAEFPALYNSAPKAVKDTAADLQKWSEPKEKKKTRRNSWLD